MSTKQEPPANNMPANMFKERVTHYLVVGEQYKVEQPAETPKIENTGWENFTWA